MGKHFIGQKRYTFVLVVFMILMMIMLIFSQMAMEIYAYSFIATKNISDIETADKILEMKNRDTKISDKKSEKKKPKKSISTKVSAVSFIMPVKQGITTSLFGDTVSRTSTHLGHDWAVEVGTKVRASADGIVEKAYYSESYGYNVLLTHENGLKTRYAHLSRLKVKYGESVRQNEVIGLSGNTGDSTGPHLHFEVIRNGTHINPMKIFKN